MTEQANTNLSDLRGADPTAEVEAWIRVGAPADADDAQGGPPDAAVEHGSPEEGQEGSVDADPVYANIVEPANSGGIRTRSFRN